MNAPPILFDLDLLMQRRARAERLGFADFIHRAVVAESIERLKEINRRFTAPVVIGPQADRWVKLLADQGLDGFRGMPDRQVLPLAETSHDLVLHGLGLHWSNDPVGILIQARRALRPDGLFIAAFFGGETLTELRAVLSEAEVTITGGLSPRIAPMADIREAGGLLQRAGFALPVADSYRLDVSYASAWHLMQDLRAMGETNVMLDRLRRPTRRTVLQGAAELYAARFPTEHGRVRAQFEVIFLTGWAPGPGQQKPLRPGSAITRLADALGVQETPAGGKAVPDISRHGRS